MTRFTSRYFLVIAAFLTSCFFVLSCENDIAEVNEFLKKQAAVEEALKVTSYMSQNGLMKAKLTAPYMIRHQPERDRSDSAYVEFPRTLHVDFYDDSTKI